MFSFDGAILFYQYLSQAPYLVQRERKVSFTSDTHLLFILDVTQHTCNTKGNSKVKLFPLNKIKFKVKVIHLFSINMYIAMQE